MLSIIVAMDTNNLIGNNNALPWHLPADFAYFKRTTTGFPVIMGRKTYESIGRPLPNRQNIIVTRDPNFSADRCQTIPSLDEIPRTDAFILGGSTIYEQMLSRVDRLYITRIHHEFTGDAYFPKLSEEWQLTSEEHHTKDEHNAYDYSFLVYTK